MAEGAEGRPRSEVVPLVLAALVCDSAFQDQATGKTSLLGIFDRIHSKSFPAEHRQLHLFVKLTDAEGLYDLSVRFIQVSTGTALGEAKGNLDAKDRLSPISMQILFPQIPPPESGKYEFQIWANDAYMGSAVLDAMLLEDEGK
jgi:Family of unknown function (DUF6941)